MSCIHPPRTDAETRAIVVNRCKFLPNGCWEYQGVKSGWGYGTAWFRGRGWRVSRIMYTMDKGEIPEGMFVCHSCDWPPCCNPAHLWLGTQSDNMRDSFAKGRRRKAHKTHCRYGHDLKEYGRLDGNTLKCRLCSRIRQRLCSGWTEEQARTLPATPLGRRPVGGTFDSRRRKAPLHTHCRRGHEFTEANTYYWAGDPWRRCRQCRALKLREQTARIAGLSPIRSPGQL